MNRSEKLIEKIERNWQAIALCAICICLTLVGIAALQARTAETATSADWGLSFGVPGAAPRGNVGKEELLQYDAYYIGNTETKTVYLTFDCGYENGNTSAILDTLREEHISATFFVVEHYLDSAPELVLKMAEDGHTVANHTATHPDASKLTTVDALQAQLAPVEEKYQALTGRELSRFYRPPQGKFSFQNLECAKQLGYKTIFWSLAYVDWNVGNQPDPTEALRKLNSRIHPGAIILLHNTSKTNAEILPTLISNWKEMGYSFGTLSDLTESDSNS